MKTFTLVCLSFFLSFSGMSQNIRVTFTATGAATQIDSVTATNLVNGQSVLLPGGAALILTPKTGIRDIPQEACSETLFPNPFPGRTTLLVQVGKPQTVIVKIQDLVGRIVAQKSLFVQSGEHEFVLSVTSSGVYLVSLTTDLGSSTLKVICNGETESSNGILYSGGIPEPGGNLQPSGLKGLESSYTLTYSSGDVIHYRCRSGIYTTIITDSPMESKNYAVEFIPCTDPDGKNYAVIKEGVQTWMAENLAWLPFAYAPLWGNKEIRFFYVNTFFFTEEAIVAKNNPAYDTYGVLYNWPAAMDEDTSGNAVSSGVTGVCPVGWHLPSDEEWTILERYGRMEESDVNEYNWRLSGNVSDWLKSPVLWNSLGGNNFSGIDALPGGFRVQCHENLGCFDPLGIEGAFWSSTGIDNDQAIIRRLSADTAGVWRNYSPTDMGYSVRCVRTTGLPSVITTDTSGISETSAVTGGNVISEGGAPVTNRGVCWNTLGNPTINDPFTSEGSGSGEFSSALAALSPGTSYYLRTYATNSYGTSYGQEIVLTTRGKNGSGIFTDPRDGNGYPYLTLGTQTWMAENLSYLPSVTPFSDRDSHDKRCYVYDYEYSCASHAWGILIANYPSSGVLYNWPGAMDGGGPDGIQGICPPGWRLPTDSDWMTLEQYLGMTFSDSRTEGWRNSGKVGKKLKSRNYWRFNLNGDNSNGFDAYPGYYPDFPQSLSSNFWTSTLSGEPDQSMARRLYYPSHSVWRGAVAADQLLSVRCVRQAGLPLVTTGEISDITGSTARVNGFISNTGQEPIAAKGICWNTEGLPTIIDSHTNDGPGEGAFTSSLTGLSPETKCFVRAYATNSAGTDYGEILKFTPSLVGTFTDSRDDHVYKWVKIGDQTWMAENLAYLPSVFPPTAGSGSMDLYYYVQGYNSGNVEEAKATANFQEYGVLYNSLSAFSACPSGWHLSSDEDWKTLEKYLGMSPSDADQTGIRGSDDLQKKLQSKSGWELPAYYRGNNSTGFSAVQGGQRDSDGVFRGLTFQSSFWSPAQWDIFNFQARTLPGPCQGIERNVKNYDTGLSVRCVKNQ
jgi:uncharacterized protein (TIGR02145 family)